MSPSSGGPKPRSPCACDRADRPGDDGTCARAHVDPLRILFVIFHLKHSMKIMGEWVRKLAQKF